MLFTPLLAVSQVEQQEPDPFQEDPFFTKPLKDWFSTDVIIERVSRRSIRAFKGEGLDSGTRDITGFSENPGLSSINLMYPAVRFNRVEALYLGFHSDRYLDWGRSSYRDINPYGSIGYSFGRKTWLYTIGIERMFGMNGNFLLGASHSRITDSEDQWRVGWVENSLISFFSVHDFMDYYARNGTQIYSVARPSRYVELSVGYTDDRYTSLDKQSGFSVFGKGRDVRHNPLIDEGKIQLLKTAFQFNAADRMLTERFGMSLDVDAEFSDVISNNSDYEYRRVQLENRTIFVVDPSAVLQNRIRVVSVTGDAPGFKYVPLGGISTMRATPFKSMMGSHVVLVNTELQMGFDFGSASFNDEIIIDATQLKFSLFADMGWTNKSISSSNKIMDGFQDFKVGDFTTDVGFGVNFSAMKIEAAWRSNDLTSRPMIWVRFNPTF